MKRHRLRATSVEVSLWDYLDNTGGDSFDDKPERDSSERDLQHVSGEFEERQQLLDTGNVESVDERESDLGGSSLRLGGEVHEGRSGESVVVRGTDTRSLEDVFDERKGDSSAKDQGIDSSLKERIAVALNVLQGAKTRARANLDAIRTLKYLQATGDEPTEQDLLTLSLFTSWGACQEIFDRRNTHFENERKELEQLLTLPEYRAAETTVLNAHYTSPLLTNALLGLLDQLGVPSNAKVLEPGCGTGNFIRSTNKYHFDGVEIDPISAEIAQRLAPNDTIHAVSFADFATRGYDAVIGNVPFGDYVIHDKVYNQSQLSIHNYFISKSLQLLEPGGIAVFITSRYTLDSVSTDARVEIARYGELLGAIRLPKVAHKETAGTTVVTDALVFKRREMTLTPEDASRCEWIDISMELGVNVSQYYISHPEQVCGELVVVNGRFGPEPIVEIEEGSLEEHVERTLTHIVDAHANAYGVNSLHESHIEITEPVKVGFIRREGNGKFVATNALGVTKDVTPPKNQVAELEQLIRLRSTLASLLESEANDQMDRAEILREQLNTLYDDYVAKYGAINRCKVTTYLDDDGEDNVKRSFPPLGGFRKDRMFRVVAALEHYDESQNQASKADIFTKRVVRGVAESTTQKTNDPQVAIAISMSNTLTVDLPTVAGLLETSEEQAKELIEPYVFFDPDSGELQDSSTYLSGNVREKLTKVGELVEEGHTEYQKNVDALTNVLPAWIPIDDIDLKLGMSWVPGDIIAKAFNSTMGIHRSSAEIECIYTSTLGVWTVKQTGSAYRNTNFTMTYGTQSLHAGELLELLLNSRKIEVFDVVDDRRVLNESATQEAQDKALELEQAIWDRVLSSPESARKIEDLYNKTFNSIVPRVYDGTALQLTGLSRSFEPRRHQLNMVLRALSIPSALAAHPVGAGKTAEMAMISQTLKRTGVIKKPMIIVPGHMVEQMAREYVQLYPNANILVVDKEDISAASRMEFVVRCATEEWDAVITTHSIFTRIPVSANTEREFLEAQLDDFRVQIEELENTTMSPVTVKRIQKKLITFEERLKKRIDVIKTDNDTLVWESLGVDYLIVDEAHMFKNLMTVSAEPSFGIDGSQRASNLLMKLDWLRKSKQGQTHQRIATFATATPVANAATELHVLFRYLGPELLKNADMVHFDAFASNYIRTANVIELNSSGTAYVPKKRVVGFANLPELRRLYSTFMDYIPPEEMDLPLPKIASNTMQVVEIPSDESLRIYTLKLGERAEAIQHRIVDPTEDNFLKITSDGRKATLDLALVNRRYEDERNSKAYVAAQKIAEIYRANIDKIYLDPETKQQHPTPGALQLVFADRGTPNGTGRSVYDKLANHLVDQGIPRSKIAFIHDAKSDDDKLRLFDKARTGQIAVLVGSTEKMGTGVNVQTRCKAIHHLDAPWRPDELTQRNGRCVRQGNQNAEVELISYVNEGSFDVFSWQVLAAKKTFIEALFANTDDRTYEESISEAVTYDRIKAIATGNPLYVERATLERDRKTLSSQQRSFQRNLARAQRGHEYVTTQINILDTTIVQVEKEIDLRNTHEREDNTLDKYRDTPRLTRIVMPHRTLASGMYTFDDAYKEVLARYESVNAWERATWTVAVRVDGLFMIEFSFGENKYGQPFHLIRVSHDTSQPLGYNTFERLATSGMIHAGDVGQTVKAIHRLIKNLDGDKQRLEQGKELLIIEKGRLEDITKQSVFPHMERLNEVTERLKEVNGLLEEQTRGQQESNREAIRNDPYQIDAYETDIQCAYEVSETAETASRYHLHLTRGGIIVEEVPIQAIGI